MSRSLGSTRSRNSSGRPRRRRACRDQELRTSFAVPPGVFRRPRPASSAVSDPGLQGCTPTGNGRIRADRPRRSLRVCYVEIPPVAVNDDGPVAGIVQCPRDRGERRIVRQRACLLPPTDATLQARPVKAGNGWRPKIVKPRARSTSSTPGASQPSLAASSMSRARAETRVPREAETMSRPTRCLSPLGPRSGRARRALGAVRAS